MKLSGPLNSNNPDYVVHPFEFAFCGYANTGKTTAITRLIAVLCKDYKIGYVKHDAHHFTMDHQGKDTYLARQSGAHMVFINDAQHNACIATHPSCDSFLKNSAFLGSDMVLLEGYKSSVMAKIVFIDPKETIIPDLQKGVFKNVVAVVGQKSSYADLPQYPVIHRDDIKSIQACVMNYMQTQADQVPLYGVVLAGGQSKRMQQDKSLLHYHGRPQVQHVAELLEPLCQKVFISNRGDQAGLPAHTVFEQIHDTFLNIGPLGGILSAMTAYPQAAWCVVACDLPFVTPETIKYLIHHRQPFKYGTAYKSAHNTLPEPLCGIYESKFRPRLFQALSQGIRCPRKILINSDIHLLDLPHKLALDNVNHPTEYTQAQKLLKNTPKGLHDK